MADRDSRDNRRKRASARRRTRRTEDAGRRPSLLKGRTKASGEKDMTVDVPVVGKISFDYTDIVKFVLLLILVIFLAVVYHNASAKDVKMSVIEGALKDKTKIEKMQKCNDRQLMQFIGLDHQNYKGYIYYKSKEALGVEEVLIIKARNKDDLSFVTDQVEKRIADQKKTFDGYGPKQMSLLGDAIIYKRGNYLYYSVGRSQEKCEGVFKRVI